MRIDADNLPVDSWAEPYRGWYYYPEQGGYELGAGAQGFGAAFSRDLLHWKRYPRNPVIKNYPRGYDALLAANPQVYPAIPGDHIRIKIYKLFYYKQLHKSGSPGIAVFPRKKYAAIPGQPDLNLYII